MEYKPLFTTLSSGRPYCNICKVDLVFKTGQAKAGHISHKHHDLAYQGVIISKKEGGQTVYYYGDS